jgi:hypothetical protein
MNCLANAAKCRDFEDLLFVTVAAVKQGPAHLALVLLGGTLGLERRNAAHAFPPTNRSFGAVHRDVAHTIGPSYRRADSA